MDFILSQDAATVMWDVCCYTWIWNEVVVALKFVSFSQSPNFCLCWIVSGADGQLGLFKPLILSDVEQFGSFNTSDVHTTVS